MNQSLAMVSSVSKPEERFSRALGHALHNSARAMTLVMGRLLTAGTGTASPSDLTTFSKKSTP
jgi:hypothetical protein